MDSGAGGKDSDERLKGLNSFSLAQKAEGEAQKLIINI